MKNTKENNITLKSERLSEVDILNQLELFISNLKSKKISHRVITYKEYPIMVFFKPYDRWLLVSIAYKKVDIRANCNFSFFTEEIYKGDYQFTNWYAFGEMRVLSINMLGEMHDKARTFCNYTAPIIGNDFLLVKYLKERYPNDKMDNFPQANLANQNETYI